MRGVPRTVELVFVIVVYKLENFRNGMNIAVVSYRRLRGFRLRFIQINGKYRPFYGIRTRNTRRRSVFESYGIDKLVFYFDFKRIIARFRRRFAYNLYVVAVSLHNFVKPRFVALVRFFENVDFVAVVCYVVAEFGRGKHQISDFEFKRYRRAVVRISTVAVIRSRPIQRISRVLFQHQRNFVNARFILSEIVAAPDFNVVGIITVPFIDFERKGASAVYYVYGSAVNHIFIETAVYSVDSVTADERFAGNLNLVVGIKIYTERRKRLILLSRRVRQRDIVAVLALDVRSNREYFSARRLQNYVETDLRSACSGTAIEVITDKSV